MSGAPVGSVFALQSASNMLSAAVAAAATSASVTEAKGLGICFAPPLPEPTSPLLMKIT